MKLKILLIALVLLLAFVYAAFNSPQVRDLIFPKQPSEGSKQTMPWQKEMPKTPKVTPASSKASGKSSRKAGTTESAREKPPNQVPNRDVSRTLIQILGAKKLAGGISLEVNDFHIIVRGEIDSEEKRRQILGILEKGREYRKLDDRLRLSR